MFFNIELLLELVVAEFYFYCFIPKNISYTNVSEGKILFLYLFSHFFCTVVAQERGREKDGEREKGGISCIMVVSPLSFVCLLFP